MIVVLESKVGALIEIGGEQVTVRSGQSLDISEEDWAALDPDVKGMFRIADFELQEELEEVVARVDAIEENGAPGGEGADLGPIEGRVTTLEAAVAVGTGAELGYAEGTASETSANITIGNATQVANRIAGLAIGPIVGKGEPVEIEFFCPAVFHAVANAYVGVALIVNGAQAMIGQQSSASLTAGRTLIVKRRLVLTEGVEYTFEVGKYIQDAATDLGTFAAGATFPMYLSVTQR